jgi:phosphoribosyl-AMP cyclohydrolase
MSFCEQLKYNADGLIPAIVQDVTNGRVLMMAWMNQASLEKTLETGKTHFWSRSRQKFWMKGESSGHTQQVKDVAFDCDGDTLLIQVEQTGAACHEGYQSCCGERGILLVLLLLLVLDQVHGSNSPPNPFGGPFFP